MTLEEILKPYELPPDLPTTRECKMCGEPLHLLRINRYVAFWIHEGEALRKCCEKNTFHPNTPFIVWYMGFSKKYATDLYQGVLKQNGIS